MYKRFITTLLGALLIGTVLTLALMPNNTPVDVATENGDGIGGALFDEKSDAWQTIPTYTPVPTLDWAPPPMAIPVSIRPEDHYWLTRPIPSDQVTWPHPYYRYGNTYFGQMRVHSGVDLKAKTGTPVSSAGDGEVVFAGWGLYDEARGRNDPYGLAIAIKHDFGYRGRDVYTVYAHLSESYVEVGDKVSQKELIALSGNTGNSSGPHLHFEVRVGRNDFYSSRNPELWMAPLTGYGSIAGRVIDEQGNYINDVKFSINSKDRDQDWLMWTYSKNVVNRDNLYQENFILSDLPAGEYEVVVRLRGQTYTADLDVYPGQTTFTVIQQGGPRALTTAEPRSNNRSVLANN